MQDIATLLAGCAPPHARKPWGRPAFRPTPEQRRSVIAMALCGLSRKQIALLVGVSHSTLHNHLRPELELAAIERSVALLHSLQMAEGFHPAAISTGKTRVARELPEGGF